MSAELLTSPLVSVLVSVYNNAPYIPQCLESIMEQTYQNLQIVIVDDGSTDASFSVCNRYASIDYRLEIYSSPHSGVSETRNRLLKLAKGKYSIFIDSDDFYCDKSVIERLVECCEKNNLDTVIFNINGSGALELRDVMTKEQALTTFLEGNDISSSVCAKLVKTDTYRKLHFAPEIYCGEDLYMTWCILNNINSVGLVSGKPYHYRNNKNSITNGGFNDKTYSLHSVWDKITEDCSIQNPELLGHARQKQIDCYERLLLTAAHSNVKQDNRITTLRSFLKKNIRTSLERKGNFLWKIAILSSVYMYSAVRLVARFYRSEMNFIR